ncbi:MAG: hypothetical protein U1F16_01140 [Turneriella sp.]
MRRVGLLCGFLVVTTTVSAGIEIGADGSIFMPKLTTRTYPVLTTTQATQFAGPLFNGYGHLTLPLTPSLQMGVGLSLGFSPQTAQEYPAGATKEELTITRFGADGRLQYDLTALFSPYIRLTLGKDWYYWKDNGITNGVHYEAESSAGGFFYAASLGVLFPLAADFALYVQGGYTASVNSAMTIRRFAVGGVNQAVAAPTVADTNYAGWLASAGARLKF